MTALFHWKMKKGIFPRIHFLETIAYQHYEQFRIEDKKMDSVYEKEADFTFRFHWNIINL